MNKFMEYGFVKNYCNSCRNEDICSFAAIKKDMETDIDINSCKEDTVNPITVGLNCRRYEDKNVGSLRSSDGSGLTKAIADMRG